MIIVTSSEGGLCNKLFHFSHLLSFSMTNNQKIWYPFFFEQQKYFPNLNHILPASKNIYFATNAFTRRMLPVINKFFYCLYLITGTFILEYFSGNKGEIDLTQNIKNAKRSLIICNGWLIRDSVNFSIQSETLRLLFKFNKTTLKRANNIINFAKSSSQVKVIGIHIRRGDYKEWQDGKYYYSDLQYEKILNSTVDLFKQNQTEIQFIICSDEPINIHGPLKKFAPLVSNGTEIDDLCLLSLCDYIIGPPSTFSSWASFMGNVPLFHIDSESTNVNFKITINK